MNLIFWLYFKLKQKLQKRGGGVVGGSHIT